MKTPAPHNPSPAEPTSTALRTVLRWVASRTDARPVDESWVPGARTKELTQLGALGALVGAVIRAYGIDAEVFEAGNLYQWVDRPDVEDRTAVRSLRALLDVEAEQNLARVYSLIVSGRSRRTLGTFFTPAAEADWMVRTWEELFPAPRTVVDVGAGVGVFSLRAAEAWPQATVLAVDINPVTLGLLALCEPAQHVGANTPGRVIPIEADFTRWVETEWDRTPAPRLVLGNPPYTRLQLMPAEDRARLTAAGGGLVGSRAALSAIITAQSLGALDPQDGLALLLPAQWLEADYAAGLRRYLWDQTHRRIELRIFGEQLFADATVDAVALLVGPVESVPRPLTVSTTGAAQVSSTTREVTDLGGFDELISTARARVVAAPVTASMPMNNFAIVRRGVATGANRFFILDEASVVEQELGPEMLTPLLRRTRSAPEELSAEAFVRIPDIDRRWLLTVKREQVVEGGALDRYLADGVVQGVPTGHLCMVRAQWFDLHHDMTIPDVIVGQASKTGFKIIDNRMRAAIANNLYGMRWLPGTTDAQRGRIVEWLRAEDGQSALRAVARVQASGLLKLEPRALANLRVPDAVTT